MIDVLFQKNICQIRSSECVVTFFVTVLLIIIEQHPMLRHVLPFARSHEYALLQPSYICFAKQTVAIFLVWFKFACSFHSCNFFFIFLKFLPQLYKICSKIRENLRQYYHYRSVSVVAVGIDRSLARPA